MVKLFYRTDGRISQVTLLGRIGRIQDRKRSGGVTSFMNPFEPLPQITLVDVVTGAARWTPESPCICFEEQILTWREFEDGTNRFANTLLAAGLQQNDTVGVLVPNCPEHLMAVFGIMKAGGVVVPLSHFLSTEILIRLIADAELRFLFLGAGFEPLTPPDALAGAGLSPDQVFFVGETPAQDPGPFRHYGEIVDAAETSPGLRPCYTDRCNIIYSSGTTGIPKGIVHTHYSRHEAALGLMAALRVRPDSNGLISTPLCSNGSWSVFLSCFASGAPVTILRDFSVEGLLAAIKTHACTWTFAVPTQLERILASPALEGADLSALEYIVSSGAPLRQSSKQALIERLDCGVFEIYGQTEGLATILTPEDFTNNMASVGRPGPGSDIVILDDNGQPVADGVAGEITGYSSALMAEYHNRPEDTEAVWWHAPDSRRFVKSGDIGKIAADGMLHILDRKKDMIISGGFNVFPKDIEDVIARYPAVQDVAVIGLPHPDWGETPVAIVIASDDADKNATELVNWTNARVAKTQRVRKVIFRQHDFPRNLIGKVLKRELRKEYADRTEQWADV